MTCKNAKNVPFAEICRMPLLPNSVLQNNIALNNKLFLCSRSIKKRERKTIMKKDSTKSLLS